MDIINQKSNKKKMYACDLRLGFELGTSAREAAMKPTELRPLKDSKVLYNTKCL